MASGEPEWRERIGEDTYTSLRNYSVHLGRYLFAADYVKQKGTVCDLACAEGYGSEILGAKGAEVVGCDISLTSVSRANHGHQSSNLNWVNLDAQELPFMEGCFQTLVSFEVIEHLVNPTKYLAECKRVTRPGGTILFSSPNRLGNLVHSPFHVREYSFAELEDLISTTFPSSKILGYLPSHSPTGRSIVTALKTATLRNALLRTVVNLTSRLPGMGGYRVIKPNRVKGIGRMNLGTDYFPYELTAESPIPTYFIVIIQR